LHSATQFISQFNITESVGGIHRRIVLWDKDKGHLLHGSIDKYWSGRLLFHVLGTSEWGGTFTFVIGKKTLFVNIILNLCDIMPQTIE